MGQAARQTSFQQDAVMTDLTLGLISDTHIPRRMKCMPKTALDALSGVDLILHAGDVDDPDSLAPLRAIAPVHAVCGNRHLHEFSDGGAALPDKIELELDRYRFVLTHGYKTGMQGFMLKSWGIFLKAIGLTDNGKFNWHIADRLVQRYAEADIIVFGHTHRAHIEQIGRTLLVNPGAVCPTRGERPSVARVTLGKSKPQVEIIPLLTDARGRLY